MNITIVIDWDTTFRITVGVVTCMLVYYGLFYDHSKKE